MSPVTESTFQTAPPTSFLAPKGFWLSGIIQTPWQLMQSSFASDLIFRPSSSASPCLTDTHESIVPISNRPITVSEARTYVAPRPPNGFEKRWSSGVREPSSSLALGNSGESQFLIGISLVFHTAINYAAGVPDSLKDPRGRTGMGMGMGIGN
ncbi:hypothetical protein BDV10DRAFT_91026 [Aspergillus recurvatus]